MPFHLIRLAGLILILGLAACAGSPVTPEEGRGRVESQAVTPDPACLGRCERPFKEAGGVPGPL